MNKLIGLLALFSTFMLSACSNEYKEYKIDSKLVESIKYYAPSNCKVTQDRYSKYISCNYVVAKQYNEETLKYNLTTKEVRDYQKLINNAFYGYVLEELKGSNELYKNCEYVATGYLSCSGKRLEPKQIFLSIVDPNYMVEKYGCNIVNDLVSLTAPVDCSGILMDRKKVAIESFWNISKNLLLTTNEKEKMWLIFNENTLTEEQYKKYFEDEKSSKE